jgi:hemerythrin superfamily protein
MPERSVKSTEDVVAFLTEQHRIKELFTETINAPDNDRQEKAFFELRSLLTMHETAEEMVVHPRARSEIEGGDEVVDARLEEGELGQEAAVGAPTHGHRLVGVCGRARGRAH